MKKTILQNILLLTVTLVIMCAVAEYVFRKIIFNTKGTFKELKDAGKYANPLTDDYWKINNYFDLNFAPPDTPHPVLGWRGYFNPHSYQHNDAQQNDTRKKVLIYGDSFVMCVDSVQCFQHILNSDASFNKNYQLLNYGVGGYGVDQIYMLCSLTVSLYDNAFIIFSIMPADMDRSILTFRIGQKPYYTLNENKLTLNGLPIAPNTNEWLKDNSVSFYSYLYQRYKYSTLNKWHNQQEEDEPYRKQILTLNSQIILEANRLLKKQNVPYVFLVFDNMYNTDGEWRLDFLKKFLPENNIPFFVSSDLVKQDKTFSTYDFNNYIIKGNGHPTSHYNQLVCNEIKNRMDIAQTQMQTPQPVYAKIYSQTDVDYWVNKIKQDNNWLAQVKQKAAQRNIALDSMIKLDAQWMIDSKK